MLTERSYCVLCDALPGECDCAGHRYLDPIVYERREGDAPTSFRWRAPDEERWRVDNPPSTWPALQRAAKVEAPEPLQHLVVTLEQWVDLDDSLEDLVREAYAHDPLKTSRLVLSIIEKAASRQLRSPGGLLVTRLRKLLHT